MRRILFINHSSGIGGAETNLLNILRFADIGGFEPCAVLLPRVGPLVDRLSEQETQVGFVDYYGFRLTSPWRYYQTIGQLCSWVHRTNADIIHLNHEYLIEYADWVGRLTRRPVICHVRNLASMSFMRRNRHHFAGVACLIAISKVVETHLLEHCVSTNKIVQVYDGIDLARFDADAYEETIRDKWPISEDAQVVGFVGRLVSWKGVEDLIRAASAVLKVLPKTVFVVVGEDEDGGQYIRSLKSIIVTCGVEHAFWFTGFERNVRAALQGMDIVVLPSHREPLGNVVIEAMAAGRLVVATNDGGTAEIVLDEITGFLVPPQQPANLAQAIIKALHLDMAKRTSMSAHARQCVQKRFTIQRQVEEIGAIYRDCGANRWKKS